MDRDCHSMALALDDMDGAAGCMESYMHAAPHKIGRVFERAGGLAQGWVPGSDISSQVVVCFTTTTCHGVLLD